MMKRIQDIKETGITKKQISIEQINVRKYVRKSEDCCEGINLRTTFIQRKEHKLQERIKKY